jgi:hypothetical protein
MLADLRDIEAGRLIYFYLLKSSGLAGGSGASASAVR